MKILTQSVIIAFTLSLALFANADKQHPKTQEYLESLPKYEGSINIDPQILKQKAEDLKIQTLREKLHNEDLSQFGEIPIQTPNIEHYKNAKEISDFTNTQDFKKELKANEGYILYDKSIDFSQYTGLNREELESLRSGWALKDNPQFSNQFLSNDEKILIVISSSIPKETILNYFKTLEKVNTDITFILQGLIGNDIAKLNPTIEYIGDLLIKDKNAPLDTPNNTYAFKVDINPKVTQKFNITHAPAVIFIKNYDKTIQEPQELQETSSGEQAFIAYGAVNVSYALTEINKKAKSKGLEKLLAQLDKSFFTEQKDKE